MPKINGIALAAAGTGAIFLWSGIKGGGVLANLQDLIKGEPPKSTGANPIDTGPGSVVVPDAPLGGTATGQQIATDALAYQGHCYSFGGAPGTNGRGCWDCSSFVNWVVGHDLRLAIPGYGPGKYDGSVHGPTTLSWLAWIGTGVTHIPLKDAGAGDIACWQTHMGIMTGPDSMISAQTPSSGTQVATGNIAGFMPGEVLFVLRLKATLPPGGKGGKK